MNYTMTTPCPKCPFRSDIEGYLTPERAEEIGEAVLYQQQTFACHLTTVPEDDEDGDGCGMRETPDSQHCAGALIFLEKQNAPNQMMRIAERLRMYDRRKLNMDAPVFDDIDEFIEANR